MAINFPSDRSELGYAPGPLQPGDVWVNNRVQYIWFTSPDGTGAWSAKGVNINPLNYINKAESFPDEIDGSYNTGFSVDTASFATNANTASTAGKVEQPLKLTFTSVDGTVTDITYDGSTEQSISFSDTDIASQQLNVTHGFGVKPIDPNTNEIAVFENTPRAFSFAASGGPDGTSTNYACEFDSTANIWKKLKAYEADGAGFLGGVPAADYATRAYVDAQVITGGTDVNLDSVLALQANQPVTGSYAEIKLEHAGAYIDLDTNGATVNGEVLPARFDISQLQQNPDGSTIGSRSLVTSEGQITLANTQNPYLAFRGRRTNDRFGFASIGLVVPPYADGFLREPQAGDGTLDINAEQIRIRTVDSPDGFFLTENTNNSNYIIDVQDYFINGVDWATAFNNAIAAAGDGDTVYLAGNQDINLTAPIIVNKSFINLHIDARIILSNNVSAIQIGTAGSYTTNCRVFVNDIVGPNSGAPRVITNQNAVGIDIRHGSFNTIDFNRIVFCHRGININASFGLCADNKILGQLIEKCRIAIRSDGGAIATQHHTEHTMIYTQFIAHFEYGIYKSGEQPGRMGSQKFWDVNTSFDAFPVDPNNTGVYQFDIFDDYMEVADLDLNACRYALHFSTGGPNGTGSLDDRDDFSGRGCVQGRNCYITEPIRGRFKFSGQSFIDTQIKDRFSIVADNGLWVTESDGVPYKVGSGGSDGGGATSLGQLNDVNVGGAIDGSLLGYDGSSGNWGPSSSLNATSTALSFNDQAIAGEVEDEEDGGTALSLAANEVLFYDDGNLRTEGQWKARIKKVRDESAARRGNLVFEISDQYKKGYVKTLEIQSNEADRDIFTNGPDIHGATIVRGKLRAEGPIHNGNDPVVIDGDVQVNGTLSGGNLGALVQSDDIEYVDGSLTGNAEAFTNAFELALTRANRINSRVGVYIPPGEYNLDRDIFTDDDGVTKQISVYSDAFTTCQINTNGHTINFECAVNLSNILFDVSGSTIGLRFARRGAVGGRPEREDMDSSISNCDFNCDNGNRDAVAIQYWGRNLKLYNSRFKTGNNIKAAIQILYSTSGPNNSDIQEGLGFRRTAITNNTFHVLSGGSAILIGEMNRNGDQRNITYTPPDIPFLSNDGDRDEDNLVTNNWDFTHEYGVTLYGLIVQNNTIDHGGTLLTNLANPTEACSVTGNTCFFNGARVINGSRQYMYFGTLNSGVVANNAFYSDDTMVSGDPPRAITIKNAGSGVLDQIRNSNNSVNTTNQNGGSVSFDLLGS